MRIRKGKKLVSLLLLAMVLVVFMSVQAFAAQTTLQTNTVDFENTEDLSKMELYQSSTDHFTIANGRLTPTGSAGELKAIYKTDAVAFTSVSVDIYPGENGIDSGVYLCASDTQNGKDQIKTLAVLVQSNFTGWTDAPNRVDLIVGQFPTWKEHGRVISETGNKNNLFTGGVKQPLRLTVTIAEKGLDITLCLISDPSVSISMTYTHTGAEDLRFGDVGLRANMSLASFDNFTVNQIDGLVASVNGNYYTSLAEAIDAANGGVVKLETNVRENIAITKDLILDLNGKVLNGNVSGNGTLYGMDSANDTYDATKAGRITGEITCSVAPVTKQNNTYIAIADDEGCSFHRIYVGITSVSLQPDLVAFGYKATFGGDELVLASVDSYGYQLGIDQNRMFSYHKEGAFTKGQVLSLRLKNILKQDAPTQNAIGASATIYGNVFANLTVNGQPLQICGNTHQYSLKQMMEAVNDNWSNLAFNKKQLVKNMTDLYLDSMTDWSLENIFGWTVEDNTLKILAVGNSFSVDAMEYLYQIAQDLGVKDIKLGNLYIGGCTLHTHNQNWQSGAAAYTYYTNENGTWVAHENHSLVDAVNSENWDYITFQQASGSSGVADTYDVLPSLVAGVKEACPTAQILWHMTWAYQGNSTHSEFPKYNSDQNTMYQAILSAVQNKILTNADIVKVIPVGTAVQNARTSYLGDKLTRDGYHLTLDVGRYIAGVTWAESILGLDTSKLTYRPSGVSADVMEIAIESAKNAVSQPYAVTNSQYTMENSYLQLDLKLTSGWYNSTNTSGDPYKIYASTSSLPFYYTKVFTKAELPVGSIILYTGNKNYRPEGWVNGAGTTRPGATSTQMVVVTEEWWGEYTERGFNIGVPSLETTAAQAAESFQIYVPLSAYEKVELQIVKAFYNSNLYPSTQTQAASSSLKFFATQTFTKDTLPAGSIIVNKDGKNIREEGWYDGSVKNSDGKRGGNTTAKQIQVNEAWWGNWTVRAFNIPVASLDDSQIDYVKSVFEIYVPKTEKVSDAISGKKIAWLGSSVTYGSASGGYSMANAIAEKREGTVCYKYAVSGTTLVNESTNSYVARMEQIDPNLELDMLVVQLSTNDATQGKTLGAISESMDMSSFDTTTVAGAIEYIIAYAKNTWDCPVVFYTGTQYNSEAYASMVSLLLDIQAKWGIGVIDLWNNPEMTALLGTSQYAQYMSDAIHPTALGYKQWWTPVFEAYMNNYWSK
ncbi:MAG: DUF4886 domain-containing protein [Oscillospiraceae bacterium]|nr:DUF4886 domain-containing protein [Oscillospiraceae bacterium]